MDVTARLRHGLIPAVPVPFIGQDLDLASQDKYARWISEQPVAGVAVWAHTGRGLYLSVAQRATILTSWRQRLPEKVIVAGAGGALNARSDSEYLQSAIEMAEQAKQLGADALLCYAPVRYRGRDDQDALCLSYHAALTEIGLPLILFYLYEAAGGISYSRKLLSELLATEKVIGIKIATLDSVMTYQDVAQLCRAVAPEKLVITGEDRFLGYSLMCGADAALIGMGAAFTNVQNELLRSFYDGDHSSFIAANALVDRLAQATFLQPMEGYIARMSYILSKQGIFNAGSWHDPWGPKITPTELAHLDAIITELT
ncbi:MAG TPA: dihydrodipicolinate synthase family protein [Candidatus Kapabacteria bacterium]|nr:dihydrodipicolinate synthase family protein [Candidatus Kapabacteria bacterium]